MDRFETVVQQENSGTRLDNFLAACMPGQSRSSVQGLIERDLVRVDGRAVKNSYRVKAGERVEVVLPPPESTKVDPEPIPLDIVYEDSALLVINKPAGMVVHPAAGNRTGTLVNALLHHSDRLWDAGDLTRPGIVHRLDKDTTGLLVVAKNEAVHRSLAGQLKARTVKRKYIALVKGVIDEDGGTIDAPIGRHPTDRKKMAVVARNSRDAVTHFSVIKRYQGYTLVEARLETGRTHQIRVHMHYIGHPVVGDPKYGKAGELGAEGLMLHAAVLGFVHPERNEYLEFEAPLPPHFLKVIEAL